MKTVFVSSTFKDMQSERDVIRNITLPALNEEARRHNDEFDFCDLRWGVNTKELDSGESSKKVLDVCLDEIDRCKPPMVVLLGYRYGWIPEKELIQTAAERKKMILDDLEKSVTALEIEYGALSDVTKFQNTLFYFREIDGLFPDDFNGEDEKHTAKINTLKKRIRDFNEKTKGRIKEYHLKWNGSGFEGLQEFANMLAEDIKELLLPQWEEYDKLTPFQKERRMHETFIREKAEMFSARKKEAEELVRRINANPVTIIKGAVGSGKSTIFSRIAQDMSASGWTVLPFISGLTSQSDSAFEIIQNTVFFLENELRENSHFIDETGPQTQQHKTHSMDEWREKLAELCRRYTDNGKKLLIMLDAADQLTQSEERDKLYFIPTNTNEHIHFAMTCTPDFDTQGRDFCTLEKIDENGKRDVIAGTLSRIRRELSEKVIRTMVSLKASENPLYLSLLVQRLTMMDMADFAEIRKNGDGMDAIENQQIEIITKKCPDDLAEMSAALLLEAGRRINPELVSKAGNYLAVSRAGLRKKDLSALLGEEWTEIDFSHFINYMNDCFMIRDDGRYDFTHKSIRAGFLKQCDTDKINTEILTYLKALPENDPVRFSELVHHAIRADDKHFFIEYIIEHKYDDINDFIEQAALDTYRQCMADSGRWICDILSNYSLFVADKHTGNFIEFINFDLSRHFTGTLIELTIQLDILKQNVLFAEYMYDQLYTNYSKRDLSVSYNMMANTYEALGGRENLLKALELYQKSLDIREHLEIMTGTNASKRDLSVSYESMGNIYEALGGRENLFKALELYQKALELSEQLEKTIGTNESKKDLSFSYNNVAGIYETLGGQENFLKALALYQKARNLSEQLEKATGTNETKRDLSVSYAKIAGIYEALGGQGNLLKALELYQKCNEIFEQLEKMTGTNENKRDLSISYSDVADIYKALGGQKNLLKALELYQKALELSEQLEKTIGTNASKRDLSISYNKVAGIYKALGGEENLLKALKFYEKCNEILEQLEKTNGTIESKRDLSLSYGMTAVIYDTLGGKGNLLKALELYQKTLALSEQLEKITGTNANKRDMSVSYAKIAGIYNALGGKENLLKALELYQKALELSEQLEKTIGTNASKRDLSISYERAAGIYEALGGKENLFKALELYQKTLNLREQLAENENTISAYDDLAISLFSVATHEYTDTKTKKQLLKRGLQISRVLYDNMPNERYEAFCGFFQQELKKID